MKMYLVVTKFNLFPPPLFRKRPLQCVNSEDTNQPVDPRLTPSLEVRVYFLYFVSRLFISCRNSFHYFRQTIFRFQGGVVVVVVMLLFYVHGKHLRSCRDGQLT